MTDRSLRDQVKALPHFTVDGMICRDPTCDGNNEDSLLQRAAVLRLLPEPRAGTVERTEELVNQIVDQAVEMLRGAESHSKELLAVEQAKREDRDMIVALAAQMTAFASAAESVGKMRSRLCGMFSATPPEGGTR